MTTEAPTVTVTHRFSAPPAAVFDAWLNPATIRRWMLGMPEEEIIGVSTDARTGGRFSFVIRRGGMLLDHAGTYLEVSPPNRLSFTWGVNENGAETSRVTVDISELPGGSELTLTHQLDPQWADFAQRTAEGWKTILGRISPVIAPAPR